MSGGEEIDNETLLAKGGLRSASIEDMHFGNFDEQTGPCP